MNQAITDSGIPLVVRFPPFLSLGERCILSKAAREKGLAEIPIIAMAARVLSAASFYISSEARIRR